MTSAPRGEDTLPSGWSIRALGSVLTLSSGKRPRLVSGGAIPVFGGNGIMGRTEAVLCDHTTIVIGREGAPGAVQVASGPIWVSDNAFHVTSIEDSVDLAFLAWAIADMRLERKAVLSG